MSFHARGGAVDATGCRDRLIDSPRHGESKREMMNRPIAGSLTFGSPNRPRFVTRCAVGSFELPSEAWSSRDQPRMSCREEVGQRPLAFLAVCSQGGRIRCGIVDRHVA